MRSYAEPAAAKTKSHSLLNQLTLISGMIITSNCLAEPGTDLAMPETFYISLGGYSVIGADTTLSLTKPNIGAGVLISPADTLGVDIESTVFRIDGHYRFTPTSQIAFSWYRIDNDAQKRLETEVDWLDGQGNEVTLAAGSEVATSFTYDIMKAGYYWSFYHNDKVELTVGGGLHISQFEIGLDLVADANGVPGSASTHNAAHTVPLPTLGLGVNYRVIPKLFWYLKAEAFYLTYNDWDGAYTEIQLGAEYNVWRNLGVGIGIVSDHLDVTEETRDYKFQYNNQLSGINLYLSTTF